MGSLIMIQVFFFLKEVKTTTKILIILAFSINEYNFGLIIYASSGTLAPNF